MKKMACGLLFALSASLAQAIELDALPSNPSIMEGSAIISESAQKLVVEQKSEEVIIHWDSFNIGENATVEFKQPEWGFAMNRVIGVMPSEIYGQLMANEAVFLMNPNGVLFGKTAQVDVGALIATSLEAPDDELLSSADSIESPHFVNNGRSGVVQNQGSLHARDVIFLFGPKVINEGEIALTEPGGAVGLAAANKVMIGIDQNDFFVIETDRTAASALVENSGVIRANGAQVVIAAGQADDALSTVINHSGVIEAKDMFFSDGRVVFVGKGGITDVSGDIKANPKHVKMIGDDVVWKH